MWLANQLTETGKKELVAHKDCSRRGDEASMDDPRTLGTAKQAQ
jgi:hypothetical protein